MMNILVVTRSLPFHHIGGMEIVAWDLSVGIAARGHKIRIITTSLQRSNSIKIPEGIEHLLHVEPLAGTRPGQYSINWWRKSREAYVRLRTSFIPDVVLSISSGAWSILPLLGRVPAIMQVHGTSLGEFKSKIRSGRLLSIVSSIKNLINSPREKSLYRGFSSLAAVGPSVSEDLIKRFMRWGWSAEKIVLIPNGINTKLFCPNPGRKANMRRRFGISQSVKVFVWASRLHREKGLHLALEAFASLDNHDFRFLIIGDGPERRNLEKQSADLGLSERVIFVGPVDRNELPGWLNAGDVFVFTSIRYEGFPMNILEALAMDLPAVLTASLAEPFVEAKGIYPVDPNDTRAVGRAMASALSSNGGGRSFIERKYSLSLTLDRYEELFKEIIRCRG